MLGVLTSMVIFGTIGIFRKYIPLPSSLIAMARGFIGMFFLLFWIRLRGKQIGWASVKKNGIALVISGIMLGFNWILLFEAYQYTSVATATLCYYMAPIIVILLSPLLFGERLTKRKMICVAVAFLGMIPVSGVLETGFSGLSEMKGILLGLGAAVLYASVVLTNKKIVGVAAFDRTLMQLGTAGLVLLPYNMVTVEWADVRFTAVSALLLVFVGILHTGIAYAMYFGSMPNLKAQTLALLSYIDPVTAILLSALVLHEPVGLMSCIGAVLVLGSTLVSELSEA